MERRVVTVVVVLALVVSSIVAAQSATVKIRAGSVIQGKIQGLVVAKAVHDTGEVEYAVIRGRDITSIDSSGVVAASAVRETYHRISPSEPGGNLPLPADPVAAWIVQLTSTWTDPGGVIRLPILGELQGPSDGKNANAARIIPTLRIKTQRGEVSVPVGQLAPPTAVKVPSELEGVPRLTTRCTRRPRELTHAVAGERDR